MEDVNHYAVLGVDPGATDDEIRKAYRAKAATTHPDLHPDNPDAEEQFRELGRAYAVLSRPEQRRAFDRHFAPITSVAQLFRFHPEGRRVMEVMLPSAPATAQQGPDAVQIIRVPANIMQRGGVVTYILPSNEEIVLTLPPAIRHHPWCRIRHHGFPGRNGALAGDLWLYITQESS